MRQRPGAQQKLARLNEQAQSGRECKCLAVEEVGPLFELKNPAIA